MKSLMTVLILSLVSGAASASTTHEENQARLALLETNRTTTLWHCNKGGQIKAVEMFKVQERASSLFSSDTIFAIRDPQICDALNVVCPFVSGVGPGTFGMTPGAQFGYWATRGKYENTVAFFSDGSGMKLVSVSNGSLPYLQWDRNWFFNEGECQQN